MIITLTQPFSPIFLKKVFFLFQTFNAQVITRLLYINECNVRKVRVFFYKFIDEIKFVSIVNYLTYLASTIHPLYPDCNVEIHK